MTASVPLPQVPCYALDAPTHESVVASLARHLGAAEAERVWAAACVAEGVPLETPATLDALARAAGCLARERTVVGVYACSIVVRLVSYSLLQQKQMTAGGAPAPHAPEGAR